jgi:hypothetical protein
VATSDADDDLKAQAQRGAEAALAEPLDAFRAAFLDGRRFVGGAAPSIADIRWAVTLESLRAIGYELPPWAEEFMEAVETALGKGLLGAGGGRARVRRLREDTAWRNRGGGSRAPGDHMGRQAAVHQPRGARVAELSEGLALPPLLVGSPTATSVERNLPRLFPPARRLRGVRFASGA